MSAEEQDANGISLPTQNRHSREKAEPSTEDELLGEQSLTDVMDQWSRQAFQRALDRRHAAPTYPAVIESARLVRTTSS
jgi:hypothetical protein